jgi:hypothetical protein
MQCNAPLSGGKADQSRRAAVFLVAIAQLAVLVHAPREQLPSLCWVSLFKKSAKRLEQ